MKAVTAFLVMFALVALGAAPVVAAGKASSVPSPRFERIDLEPQVLAPESEAAPAPVRMQNTEALVPIPPGIYTVGALGVYPKISDAVIALQTNGVAGGGTVIFRLIDPLYSDSGQTIGGYPGQSAANPVVFDVAPGNIATIFFTGGVGNAGGTGGAGNWAFRFLGAQGVTIDGAGVGPAGRSLIMDCDTVVTFNRNGVVIANGSKDIAIKNSVIRGTRRAASTGFGLIRVNNTGFAASGGQNNILIENNWLLRGSDGVQHVAAGTVTGVWDTNFVVRGNLMGGAGDPSNFANLHGFGMTSQGAVNSLYENNEVYGIRATASCYGISVTMNVNAVVRNNKIHDIVLLSGTGRPHGMNLQGGLVNSGQARATITAYNNMIYDLHNLGTLGARAYRGFAFGAFAGTRATITLYNNTVHIVTAAGEAGGPGGPTGFAVDFNAFGSGTGLDTDTAYIYGNIFSQKRATDFSRTYLMFTSSSMGVFANNNLFYQPDGGAFAQWPDPFPTGAAVVDSRAVWFASTGNDGASADGDPLFVSNTDAHISTAVGAVSPADSLALPYPGVALDIDAQVRDLARPDAGADEFVVTRFVNDLAALSVDSPLPTQILKAGAPFSPVATFLNPGTANHAAAPVVAQILDVSSTVVYTGPSTVAILGYDNTAQVTFPAVPGLAAGTYTLRVIAQLPGDANAANDTVTGSLLVQATIALTPSTPYFQNFEGGTAGWLTNAEPGSPNDWVLAKPKKTQLNAAYSGLNAWVTKDTLNHSDNIEAYVNAPILDLTGFTGLLLVQFYHNFKTEWEWDGADLQISTDAGISWRRVDSTLGTGPNFNTPTSVAWYNEGVGLSNIAPPYWGGGDGGGIGSPGYASAVGGYIRSSSVLAGLAGLPDVRFRWHFSADAATNSEGWAFDDVTFGTIPNNDIGWASLGIPGYVGGPVPSEAIQVNQGRKGTIPVKPTEAAVPLGAVTTNAPLNFLAQVQNFGANPQASYSVNWDIDGVPEAPVANTENLDFADVDSLTLTWAVPTVGFHAATGVLSLVGDEVAANDTATFNFEVLDPSVVFYEGFNGTTFPPAGWDTLNLDGNVGSVTSWYRSVGFPYEGPASARANFNGANGFFIDEWLITPNTGSLFETSFTVDSLTFWASNFPGSIYPESLMVMVSTTTTDVDSFTLVLGYVEIPSSGYTKFTFALPDAAVRYIAFRRLIYDGGPTGNNSDNLFLDDVRITRYLYTNTFTATPGALNFGTLPLGFSANQDVKVKNTGNIPLNVTSVTSSNPVFAVAPGAAVLAPGDSVNFTVTFTPAVTGAAAADIIFVHDGDTTPDTVTAAGIGGDEIKFLSITPDTLRAKDPVKLKLLKPVKRAKPGKPILPPNWANLFDETVAQGGFQPGASEGDDAGGMVVGISHMFEAAPTKWKVVKDSAAVRAWVRLTKWNFKKNIGKSFNALQKTMEDKTGIHDLLPVRGFTTTTDGKNKPILKQQTKLVPKKQDSPLFAELVALKFNIAASQLGKTPEGYGDLIFDVNGNFLDEMSLLEVSEMADSMMTYHYLYTQDQFDSLYSAVSAANRAFLGPLDTLTFMVGDSAFPLGKLTLKGQVNLAAVPYLKLPATFTVTRLAATTSEVESDEDFDQSDDEDYEELPVAAKLYQNYPNPFNPATTIAFALREASNVTITVYNLLGQQVATLLNNEELEEGINTLQFDAIQLSSGVYFYRIEAQGLGDEALKTVETRKMMLLK